MKCISMLMLAVVLPQTDCFSSPHNHQIRKSSLSYQQESQTESKTLDFEDVASGADVISQEQHSRRAFIGAMVLTGAFTLSNGPSEAATTASASTEASSSSKSSSKSPQSTTNIVASTSSTSIDWEGILKKSSKRALGGGKAGAAAAVIQVCSLMWLRTSMNHQYRYGGNLRSSLATLWEEGGIGRLYQGLPFALVQGPLTRFGDTAANVGVLVLLESLDATRDLPLVVKTAAGSVTAGLWRIVLMPVDASKTIMQVEGKEGFDKLWSNVLTNGPGPLYRGALAQAAATTAGHFPWFATYNFLDQQIPVVTASDDLLLSLARSAVLGLSASCVSDCVSNSLRVIKTTKQTAQLGTTDGEELSYPQIVAMIIDQDGIAGLLGRGLQTRLLTNAIQGSLFSVVWKYFQQVGAM
mmetsp:Transcript_7182/g.9316  ORF Transcript_7182/g.9316 Transcript_7182/m.9316 type:complete len:411 (-) Transcript_7182:196-1428(-)|eukprot:CAMPEP_0198148436 /NCGR_PEP_ID=MMETSP1443-20131203/41409_1 /TAXON_ID=186043 /ORGANISM="Entomoneis sp., Strain CCMP2396" /LENGTH=410 /DNA_ID=CAMNT_0043813121 /DNA_START=41 /DNA_END=1273 /DNA_ORIENTATION=-